MENIAAKKISGFEEINQIIGDSTQAELEYLRKYKAHRNEYAREWYHKHKGRIVKYQPKPKQVCEYITIHGRRCERTTFKKYCGHHIRYAVSRGLDNIKVD